MVTAKDLVPLAAVTKLLSVGSPTNTKSPPGQSRVQAFAPREPVSSRPAAEVRNSGNSGLPARGRPCTSRRSALGIAASAPQITWSSPSARVPSEERSPHGHQAQSADVGRDGVQMRAENEGGFSVPTSRREGSGCRLPLQRTGLDRRLSQGGLPRNPAAAPPGTPPISVPLRKSRECAICPKTDPDPSRDYY